MQTAPQCVYRYDVASADAQSVRGLVDRTGFFSREEADVAVELVSERLAKGDASGYFFVFAEEHGTLLGYACYGPIACSVHSHDLYWIVVDPTCQGRGLGRSLMREAEQRAQQAGGRRMYVDTSNREQYLPTRAFYERCGYERAATLTDFYAPGDDKVIYCRVL